ncbi:MAG: type II toxin-antitoxin system RelE/ParE family toxin [Hydrogenovibrio sp.]|uniref:type II toxin-antitoxin system RelE/ParE family toxin n=1 Tax=Hydrogenovibrio TaxID=28884 RepID=UPI0003674ABB|nr:MULTISPECIES: type II toxin-antitoxin system RelE/ParE family toxin [Hydrogenovibrio]MDR9499362.1 type II toxin-antitoxin system RelE/ParE family toxin [Hydrogenovibrio sp.]
MKYELSEFAVLDLEDIYVYSAQQFGVNQAEKYFQDVIEQCEQLQIYPELGQDISDIKQRYRRLVHQSHVIYYRLDAKKILIARILHGSQDPARHLSL